MTIQTYGNWRTRAAWVALITMSISLASPSEAAKKSQGASAASAKSASTGSANSAKNSGKEWFFRVNATAYDTATGARFDAANAAVLGQLNDSHTGYDRHDIKTYASTAGEKVAAVFVQDDWQEQSGEYVSDYRKPGRASDSWLMSVNSNVSGDITLRWNGIYDVIRTNDPDNRVGYYERENRQHKFMPRLQLIDLTTLIVVPAISDGKLNTYKFTATGPGEVRNFRWVLGPINSSYFEPGSGAFQFIKAQSRELEERKAQWKEKEKREGHPVFGLPPMPEQ
ncbi:MAG: hypothetical protein ABJ013_15010 [Halioglobus sp.]